MSGMREGAAPLAAAECDALLAPLAGRPLALAVSGGADSMALLHLVAGWWQRRDAASPLHRGMPEPLVLTVDHALRPESGAEAARVAIAAQRRGLRHILLRWPGPHPSTGLQAAARAARYRLICDALVREAGARGDLRQLVTAHHLDDQAETFLMRLARGSGIDGLAGMRAEEHIEVERSQERPAACRLVILRPLLALPKSRLIATLMSAGITWSEDPSNANHDFERVRIRNALLALERIGIGAEAIAVSADRVARARAAILAAVDAASGAIDWHDGAYASIPASALLDLPAEVAIRLLAGMIAGNGGTAAPPRLTELERLHARLRFVGLSGARAGREAATLGGCRIDWRAGGTVRVWREAGRAGGPQAIVLRPGDRVWWDRRYEIALEGSASHPLTLGPLGGEGWRRLRALDEGIARRRLPPGAAAMLPACRRDETIVAVGSLLASNCAGLTIRARTGARQASPDPSAPTQW